MQQDEMVAITSAMSMQYTVALRISLIILWPRYQSKKFKIKTLLQVTKILYDNSDFFK